MPHNLGIYLSCVVPGVCSVVWKQSVYRQAIDCIPNIVHKIQIWALCRLMAVCKNISLFRSWPSWTTMYPHVDLLSCCFLTCICTLLHGILWDKFYVKVKTHGFVALSVGTSLVCIQVTGDKTSLATFVWRGEDHLGTLKNHTQKNNWSEVAKQITVLLFNRWICVNVVHDSVNKTLLSL